MVPRVFRFIIRDNQTTIVLAAVIILARNQTNYERPRVKPVTLGL